MEITEASVWGEVYEIVTKRGSLMALADAGLLSASHPLVTQWSSKQLVDVLIRVKELLYSDVLNAKIDQNVDNYFLHFSKVAFGQGYTNTREFLRKIRPKMNARKKVNPNWSLSGLWCPLTMPGDETRAWITDYTTQAEAEEIQKFIQQTKEAFCGQFSIAYQANMLNKGMYGRADFLAVIRVKRAHHILVQEYSCFYTKNEAEIFDVDDSFTYLNEYKRYVMQSESHSVFSFVNTEAQEIPFKFSDKLRHFLPAFVRKEKPLFKLAQGCSYASTFAEVYKKILNLKQKDVDVLHLNVMAITSRGGEYITAEYTAPEKSPELTIIEQLGQEYRHGVLTLNDIEQRTQLQRELIEYLVHEPLKNMNRLLAQNISNIKFGQDLTFSVTEEIEGFYNPNQEFEKDQVFNLIERFVDQPYHKTLKNLVEADIKKINMGQLLNKKAFTLRDLHKCAVVMALMESKRGQINYICLGGTPGIGKTSSVKTMLEALDGFFFFYASPRVLINDDVVTDLAKHSVTVTSNTEIISQTKQIYKELNGTDTVVNARGGALVGGIQNFKIDPGANILLFDQDRYRALKELDESRQSDQHYVAASESKSVAINKKVARVFESLGYATCQLLQCNPEIRKLTMTVATQAFSRHNISAAGARNPKEQFSSAKIISSLDALESMFQYKMDKDHTKATIERFEFAKKFPHIVVMFDEITGDSGCRCFIDEMNKFLHRNFIEPFHGQSPFTVTVILADASLSNVNAMQGYMKAIDSLPAKMFISPSVGDYPFKVTTAPINTGQFFKSAMHILANCYPANTLKVEYILKQYAVVPEKDDFGVLKNLHQLFRKESADRCQQTAIELIQQQLEIGKKQVIYFAQDKNALAVLKEALINQNIILPSDIGIFDSQLSGYARTELLGKKEELKIVLITSTAARGISFPNCDSIIAAMPRFAIEASLMEIAQLVYRGRGGYMDKSNNVWVNGDELDRRLTILVEDFYLAHDDVFQSELDLKIKSSLDMLSIFMLIRGTLLTRIKGDAGFKKSPIAMIPIGEVKDKSSERPGLAQAIRDFFKDTNSVMQKLVSAEGELVGRLKAVIEKAENVYSGNKLSSTYNVKTNRFRSFYTSAQYFDSNKDQFYEEWCREYHALKSKLIFLKSQSDSLTIPENIYISGPVIMEDRSFFVNKESFEVANNNISKESLKVLKNELIALRTNYPQLKNFKNIQKHITNILKMIESLVQLETDSYIKELEQQGLIRQLWLAYPVASNQLIKIQDKSFDKDWFDVLRSELKTKDAEFPVVPEYKDHPFRATQLLHGHPIYENLFKQHNFMMCHELNLVNALTLF